MSPIFARLFKQALVREHAKLLTAYAVVRNITDLTGGPRDILAVNRLATSIVNAAIDFDARLRIVSDRNRMRRPRIRLACPICQQEHCPGAELSISLGTSQGVMLHILAGGQPLDYET